MFECNSYSIDPLRARRRKIFFYAIFISLTSIQCLIIFRIYALLQPALFSVHFLQVGQGDAILIESPSKKQILIDGGPDRSVLQELSQILPWNDRTIDILTNTHPDADHNTGLVAVLSRYRVSSFIDAGNRKVDTSGSLSPLQKNIATLLAQKHISHVVLSRDQVIDFGDGLFIHVLYPDREVGEWQKTNNSSLILKVVYGNFSLMLTGDTASPFEKYLISLDGKYLDSTLLKAGHHGSRTSNAPELFDAVSPEIFVISAGKNNRYGHPHADTLARAEQAGVEKTKILDTREGRVSLMSDGRKVWFK